MILTDFRLPRGSNFQYFLINVIDFKRKRLDLDFIRPNMVYPMLLKTILNKKNGASEINVISTMGKTAQNQMF